MKTISIKHDQVLADVNINSQISNLSTKIEKLEKKNMEVRRIVINIYAKLSSNKNMTKNTKK